MDKRVVESILKIVAMERDRASVDWRAVETEAEATIAYVNENDVEIVNILYNFLEDADARKKSPRYAKQQSEDVLAALTRANRFS